MNRGSQTNRSNTKPRCWGSIYDLGRSPFLSGKNDIIFNTTNIHKPKNDLNKNFRGNKAANLPDANKVALASAAAWDLFETTCHLPRHGSVRSTMVTRAHYGCGVNRAQGTAQRDDLESRFRNGWDLGMINSEGPTWKTATAVLAGGYESRNEAAEVSNQKTVPSRDKKRTVGSIGS